MTFLIYLLRWQLSTLILAPCITIISPRFGTLRATVAANLIGGCLFYFFDRWLLA